MNRQSNFIGFLNLDHYTDLDINRKQKKDNDTVGGHTAMSGLTNVSSQLHNSATTTWSAITARTKDRPHTNIQQEEAPHRSRMISLESSNKENKKKIDDMTQKISQLQSSIATLTASQKKTSEEINRQKKWQDTVSGQLSNLGQCQKNRYKIVKQAAEDNRSWDAKLDLVLSILAPNQALPKSQPAGQINNMNRQSNFIMTVNQGGTQPQQSHPANVVTQTRNNYGGQQLITPPPHQGGEI